MTNRTINAIILLLAILFLISIAAQIQAFVHGNYKTETALRFTAEDTVEFKGVYVRDEKVISDNIQGVVSYMYPDGSKIAKNSVAAVVYSDTDAIRINEEIDKIERQIEILSKSQNPGTTEEAQPEFITKQLDLSYNKIMTYIEDGDYDLIQKEKENFQVLSNILQIVIGNEKNYNDLITSHKERLKELRAQQKQPIHTVKTDEAGYFVSYADGYEQILKKDNIDNITVDMIKSITADKNANTPKQSIGKTIYGYNWKMIGIIDNSDGRIFEGVPISIRLSSVDYPIKVQIEKIKKTDNPNESIIILSCDNMTEDLVQHRVETVRMVIDECTGIKVPRNAIRFNGDVEKGVYVQIGEQILFKSIDVIYDAGEYVISEETERRGTLQLYDDIIVEGIPRQDEVITEETDPPVTETSKEINIIVGETTKVNTEKEVTEASSEGSADNE